jgi:hypothetical protein
MPRGIIYAQTRDLGGSGGVSMHRLIMGFPKNLIDHKNLNGLDNRKDNLRAANKSKNAMNVQKRGGSNTSKFKGVSLCKCTGRWRACIRINGKHLKLGRFNDEKSAAEAYDSAAVKHFGQFSRLNFPKS